MKGYKTVIFNGLIGTIGVLEVADYSFLPDESKGPMLIAVAVIGVWLRSITSTPLGKDM